MVLSMSSAGRPHIAWWESNAEVGWFIQWRDETGRVRLVSELGSRVLSNRSIGFGLTNETASDVPRPHFLIDRFGEDRRTLFLDYLTTDDDGEWIAYHIAERDPSTGDVRLLYSRRRHTVTARPECDGGRGCRWVCERSIEGDLRVAWIEDGELRERVVLDDVVPIGLSAQLDASGETHIVFYDSVLGSGESSVRYLRLAAP
jgi:hypothetical protein